MRRRSAALSALLLLLVTAATVSAAGMITAKETGAFTVPGNEIGYGANHTFSATVEPGSTVDSGIARLAPGASFGWHYHNGMVLVTVTAGTITLYDPSCDRQDVSAGSGFIEEPGVKHLARNESASLVVIAWTYVGVPNGQPEDVYMPPSYDPCGGIF